MNANTEHNLIGSGSFLPGGAVLVPVVLAITLGLFFLWYLFTGTVLASLDLPLELVLPSLVLPLLAAFVVSHNERLWAYLALASLVVFVFRESDGRIKLEELFYSVFVLSGIIVWFVKEVVVFRRRIIRTSFDFFLLTAWVLANVIATIAFLVHQGDGLTFVKELLIQFTLLLYFPLRRSIDTDGRLKIMIGIFVGLCLINGVHSALTYQERVIESALEFGFVAARVASNEALSMLLALISFTLLAYARSLFLYLAGAAGTAAGIAFVVMSMSRGPIAATLLGMLAVIALVPVKQGIKLAATMIAVIGFNIAALSLLFPTFASSILENIGDRLSTVEKLNVDKSLGSRVAESRSLLEDYIPASPMIGYGYGVTYSFYDAPFSVTAHPYFIHNGYVYPLYKYGVPAGLFFLLMLFYPLLKTTVVRPKRDSGFPRAIMIGAAACLVAILLTNLTSSKFSMHVDSAIFVVIFVSFDYMWRITPSGSRTIALIKK